MMASRLDRRTDVGGGCGGHGRRYFAWPPVGDNVNTAELETLAAPYPQVIAGTPNSWSFDNGTFQLSYSTERADGDLAQLVSCRHPMGFGWLMAMDIAVRVRSTKSGCRLEDDHGCGNAGSRRP
jgi:hypothetical protein